MIRVVLALCLLVTTARAAPEDDYQAATKLATTNAAEAITAFEQLGAIRPVSAWTDNAWSEAGRLAERIGELERARKAYEQVLALTADPRLRDRARGALDRLGDTRWDAVKREHAAWNAESLRGDPQDALDQLEQLARDNPEYPDRANIWLAVARGWELEGDADRALELLREPLAKAGPQDRAKLGFAFVRIAIRRGFLDDARRTLDDLTGADRGVIAKLRERLETAEHRAWWRRGMWIAVAVFLALAGWMLRREAGSWRAAGKQLIRPPSEVVFLLPIAGVLVAIAFTGNPVVARALLGILAAGVVAAWLSGVLFTLRRLRGPIGAARAIAQSALTIAAIGCVTYLAIDRDRLLDLVEETVEHGPTAR